MFFTVIRWIVEEEDETLWIRKSVFLTEWFSSSSSNCSLMLMFVVFLDLSWNNNNYLMFLSKTFKISYKHSFSLKSPQTSTNMCNYLCHTIGRRNHILIFCQRYEISEVYPFLVFLFNKSRKEKSLNISFKICFVHSSLNFLFWHAQFILSSFKIDFLYWQLNLHHFLFVFFHRCVEPQFS